MRFLVKILRNMFAAVAVLGAVQAAQSAEVLNGASERLEIEANKGQLIRLDQPASDIFIANPGIADVRVKSPRLIYILGRSQGETTLYALDGEEKPLYTATIVVTHNLRRLEQTFDELLPQASIQVRPVNGMLVLDGFVNSPAEAEAAERYARRFAGGEGDTVVNNIEIVQATQVNLRVKIAEVSRTTLKELGFNWESLFSNSDSLVGVFTGSNVFEDVINPSTGQVTRTFFTPGDSDSILGSLQRGNFDLNVVIDALEDEGFLSILAEPNLTAITGETASFLAGGEFPVPVPEDDEIGIEFKEFGVRLAFTPVVLTHGRISLRVAPEVSELSNEGAIVINGLGVPSLTSRRAETVVELGSGQSFAIAGLLQNNITQDASKLPGLGNIPIIGALFRSDRFRREETELLIVVTPYVVRPVSERRIALPTDDLVAPTDWDRYVHGEMVKRRPDIVQIPGDDRVPNLKSRAGFRLK